ncbi:MAG: SCO family protein [Polyangiaceae bacterium]|nr:SCO family protein [Polyangiaceae bacterium]
MAAVCALLVVVFCARSSWAQVNAMPRELEHVGVSEHLEGQLPLDTPFRDHLGKPVTLRELFDGKRPVVLTFAYYSCPVLCSMVLSAAVTGLKDVPWTVGKEFEAITISIDPNEPLDRTAKKRASLLKEYGRAGTGEKAGWHFLTGDSASIAAVANAAGFEYEYDERQKQWAHPTVLMITTPEGKMARYLYGLEFPAQDLRLGLLEASQGRSISTVEKLILYCYHYDPQGGKYVLVAMRVMQVGAGAVAMVLIMALALFWGRELRINGRSARFFDRSWQGARERVGVKE